MKGRSEDNHPAGRMSAGRRSKLRFIIPVALLIAVAAVACGGSSGGPSGTGESAPDFTVTMFQGQDVVGGQEVNFHSLVGEKPVVLNFWAGLCPPCRAEMPDFETFNEKFQDRVLLLGIDIGQFTGLGTQRDAQDLLEELGVTYPAGFTTGSQVIEDYGVLGMPTTVFIDAQGKIFNKWTGALNLKVLEEKTLEMLNQ